MKWEQCHRTTTQHWKVWHPDNELVLTIGDLARIAQADQQVTS